jgi:hypothetical protein
MNLAVDLTLQPINLTGAFNSVDDMNQTSIGEESLDAESKQIIKAVCNLYNDLLDDIDDNPTRTSHEKHMLYKDLDKVAWGVIKEIEGIPSFTIPAQDDWIPMIDNAIIVSQQWKKYLKIHASIRKFHMAYMNLLNWIYTKGGGSFGVEYYSNRIGYHYD